MQLHPWRGLLVAFLLAVLGGAMACSAPSSPARRASSPSGQRPAATRAETRPPACRPVATTQHGKGVWYGSKHHGRKTASGERFDKNAMTAAHRTLPFGTVVRVTNLRNRRSVTVRINDRGPYGKGRIIDVSEAAARQLDMIRAGVVPVKIHVVKLGTGKGRRRHACQ